MYFLSVLLLSLVLPVGSIWAEHACLHPAAPLFDLAARWFVFWAVGARLFIAGLRQMIQPRFTAQAIFGLTGDEPLPIVRELGVANLATGAVGLLSFLRPDFILPVAIAAAIFYGLAGIRHVFQPHRTFNENIALVSDLFLGALFAGAIAFVVAINHGVDIVLPR